MEAFPHRYCVRGSGRVVGEMDLAADRLPLLRFASPAQFDGPGDRWSPETLLVGALAGCFILTFRSVARASKLPWASLDCDVTGTLDRVDRVTQFTTFEIHAHLALPAGTDREQAQRALEKAEHLCLISNSLTGVIRLHTDIEVAAEPVAESARA